jgi:hypothetical protein
MSTRRCRLDLTSGGRRRALAAAVLLVSLGALAAGPAQAQQTCKYASIAATAPASRFTDNGDGTVTDTATGLQWKRCSEGQAWSGGTCAGSATSHNWQDALQLAATASYAGKDDWRLLNIKELASIVEQACYGPAIDMTVFPATPWYPSSYWSSTPEVYDGYSGRGVNFYYGNIWTYGKEYPVYYARLVRGGEASLSGGLNDTGVDWWADASQNNLASEPAGYPGQDASHGRDASHSNDTDGHAGFAFTKLDANGQPLPVSAPSWSCVRDEVTGLVWEVKTDDGGLRDREFQYTWYNPDPATNGGSAGTPDPGRLGGSDNCLDGARCDTEKYMADVNAAKLCGASNWRLPSQQELRSIRDHSSRDRPAVDTAYFPDVGWNRGSSEVYFSSSPDAYAVDHAWGLDFYSGADWKPPKLGGSHVRLVRGGQADDHDNAIGTATPVALGATVNGSLEVGGDTDYFALTVTASGLLAVSTTGSTDTAGALLDASGVELASADSGGAGANFVLSYRVTPGTYYMRVQGASPGTTGGYSLTSGFAAGGRRADLDGDGKSDLLWRHASTGDNAIWLMDGATVTASPIITPVSDSGWHIVGTGDLDGDGKSDLVWRHSPSGLNAVWLMDGATVKAAPLIPAVPDAGWAIVR